MENSVSNASQVRKRGSPSIDVDLTEQTPAPPASASTSNVTLVQPTSSVVSTSSASSTKKRRGSTNSQAADEEPEHYVIEKNIFFRGQGRLYGCSVARSTVSSLGLDGNCSGCYLVFRPFGSLLYGPTGPHTLSPCEYSWAESFCTTHDRECAILPRKDLVLLRAATPLHSSVSVNGGRRAAVDLSAVDLGTAGPTISNPVVITIVDSPPSGSTQPSDNVARAAVMPPSQTPVRLMASDLTPDSQVVRADRRSAQVPPAPAKPVGSRATNQLGYLTPPASPAYDPKQNY